MATRARPRPLPAPPRAPPRAPPPRPHLPRARPIAASFGQAAAGTWASKEFQQLSPTRMAADKPMSWLANKAAAQPYTIAARASWKPEEPFASRGRQPVKRPTTPGGGSSGAGAPSAAAMLASSSAGAAGAASNTQASHLSDGHTPKFHESSAPSGQQHCTSCKVHAVGLAQT